MHIIHASFSALLYKLGLILGALYNFQITRNKIIYTAVPRTILTNI